MQIAPADGEESSGKRDACMRYGSVPGGNGVVFEVVVESQTETMDATV